MLFQSLDGCCFLFMTCTFWDLSLRERQVSPHLGCLDTWQLGALTNFQWKLRKPPIACSFGGRSDTHALVLAAWSCSIQSKTDRTIAGYSDNGRLSLRCKGWFAARFSWSFPSGHRSPLKQSLRSCLCKCDKASMSHSWPSRLKSERFEGWSYRLLRGFRHSCS